MSEENKGENVGAQPLDGVVIADALQEPEAGPAEPVLDPPAAAVENEERPAQPVQEAGEEDDDIVELAHFPPHRPPPRPFFDVPRGRGRRGPPPDHIREAAYQAYNIHLEALAIHELRRAQMARQGFLVEFQDDPAEDVEPIVMPVQEIRLGQPRRRPAEPVWRQMPDFVIADDSDSDSSGIGTDEESSSSSGESDNEDSDYDDNEFYPDPDGAIRAEAERIMLARLHF